MKRLTEVPKTIQGGALYPRSEALRKQFSLKDRFGEPYELYLDDIPLDGMWVPRNCAPELSESQAEEVYQFSVGPRGYSWHDGFKARNSEQTRLVKESVGLLLTKGVRGGHIIEAPTGFGKTYVGASIIQRVGVRACVITTKEDIMDDWKVALSKTLNIDLDSVGIWRGDVVPTEKHQAVVALVQSVCKGHHRYGYPTYRDFGMVMVDTKWDVPIVWHWEEKEMGPLDIPWGRAIVAVKHLQADVRRNAVIVNFLKAALKKGRNTVVFSDVVGHLQMIAAACLEAGMPNDQKTFGWYCGLQSGVYGKVKEGYAPAKEQREQSKLARICFATYKMASEATDVPWWDTCVLATPKADVTQPVGRILREFEGKQEPLVLDLCDYNHHVLATFAGSRRQWYREIGAKIVHM